MKVLEVEKLVKKYKKGWGKTFQVLHEVSFSIESGKVTGFLGSNGAGKTTTLKCILNLAIPDAGTIRFFEKGALDTELKNQIGFLPERPYFYEYLTGEEFLRFYGQLSTNLKTSDLKLRIDKLLKKVNLSHAAKRQLRTYSKGMLQRVGMAQALIHEPKLIILDEPMAGLDPDGRMEISNIISDTAKSGAAVFFSSHLLNDAETLCDNLVILKTGSLVYEGPTHALLDSLKSGFKLSYASAGQIVSELLPTLQDLQLRVDQLRAQKLDIIEVKNERPRLDDAFARIAAGYSRD